MAARDSGAIIIAGHSHVAALLLFDHFLMHRTWRDATMTKPRYAIESWFFAPSAYPETQTGLYV